MFPEARVQRACLVEAWSLRHAYNGRASLRHSYSRPQPLQTGAPVPLGGSAVRLGRDGLRARCGGPPSPAPCPYKVASQQVPAQPSHHAAHCPRTSERSVRVKLASPIRRSLASTRSSRLQALSGAWSHGAGRIRTTPSNTGVDPVTANRTARLATRPDSEGMHIMIASRLQSEIAPCHAISDGTGMPA